jgi:hypothetical protein
VDESTRTTLRAAEEAVAALVEACAKDGPLYPCDPRAVAQVSRTGKWHLSAIAALAKALDAPCTDAGQQAG